VQVDDLREPRKLASLLLRAKTPLEKHLRGKLTPGEHEKLSILLTPQSQLTRQKAVTFAALIPDDERSGMIGSLVARALDRAITDTDLYDAKRFAKIRLRPEAAALVKAAPEARWSATLRNRLLLEDAFPAQIARVELPKQVLSCAVSGRGLRRHRFTSPENFEKYVQTEGILDPDEAEFYAEYLRERSISTLHECIVAAAKGATLLVLLPMPSEQSAPQERPGTWWICGHIPIQRTLHLPPATGKDSPLQARDGSLLMRELHEVINSPQCWRFDVRLPDPPLQQPKPFGKKPHVIHPVSSGVLPPLTHEDDGLRRISPTGRWGSIAYIPRPLHDSEDEAPDRTIFTEEYVKPWPAKDAEYTLFIQEDRAGAPVGLRFMIGGGMLLIGSAPSDVTDVLTCLDRVLRVMAQPSGSSETSLKPVAPKTPRKKRGRKRETNPAEDAERLKRWRTLRAEAPGMKLKDGASEMGISPRDLYGSIKRAEGRLRYRTRQTQS
jgi:hypothetical protein